MSRRILPSIALIASLPLAFSAPAFAAGHHHGGRAKVPAVVAHKPSATSSARRADATNWSFRATANPTRIRDGRGLYWEAMPATWGTRNASSKLVGKRVARTTMPYLYQRNAWGATGAMVPVPGKGMYRVHLLLTEDTYATAGRRVFDVLAENRLAVSNVDIAKAVGANAAYDVSFNVPVTDGELTLAFRKKVDLPTISGIEVTSVGAVIPVAQQPYAVKFAPNNVWTQDVSNAPLADNSAAVSANIAAQVRNNWGGTAATNAYDFTTSLAVASPSTPKIRVGFFDCQRKGYTPPQLYSGPAYFADVPVPANAMPARGTDRQLTVYSPSLDKVWDFWQMRRTATGGWEACWGGRLDNVSKQTRTAFPDNGGASASGLAIAGGMITMDDIKRGYINHAMNINVIDARVWTQVSWPANRGDGTSYDPNTVMEGQRLRLPADLDVSKYNLTPFGRMVAEAGKKYGFIVTDRAGAVSVTTQSGDLAQQVTGTNPWDTLLGGPNYSALQNFPWDNIQVVRANWGAPA